MFCLLMRAEENFGDGDKNLLHSTTPDDKEQKNFLMKNYHLKSARVVTFAVRFTRKRSLKLEIISYCANTP
jgi:hypothetical protein